MNTVVSLGLMLLIMVGAVLGMHWDRRSRRNLRRPFSPAFWQQVGSRWQIVQDLLHGGQLLGLRRPQVLELLGEPDDGGCGGMLAATFGKSEQQAMGYKLSEDDDCDWLVVLFDDRDCAVDCRVVCGW